MKKARYDDARILTTRQRGGLVRGNGSCIMGIIDDAVFAQTTTNRSSYCSSMVRH